jgi:hypothetical protein
MEQNIIEPPKGFKTSRFWRDCSVCLGFGIVPAHHPFAANEAGKPTGTGYPNMTGGCSGEVVAEPHKSYCGKCSGTGMVLKQ